MLSKIKVALSAAIVLSNAFSASAATKQHRVTHVHTGIYNRLIPAAGDRDRVLNLHDYRSSLVAISRQRAGVMIFRSPLGGEAHVGSQEASFRHSLQRWSLHRFR